MDTHELPAPWAPVSNARRVTGAQFSVAPEINSTGIAIKQRSFFRQCFSSRPLMFLAKSWTEDAVSTSQSSVLRALQGKTAPYCTNRVPHEY
jgi:hypothetical protein